MVEINLLLVDILFVMATYKETEKRGSNGKWENPGYNGIW